MDVRFVSANEHKIRETQEILGRLDVAIKPVALKIDELQTRDTSRLVRHKALEAFRQIGRPLFVEHTSLSLEYLNGLPDGLTRVFWETLEADRFAALFGQSHGGKATAQTHVCFIDGERFYDFFGEVTGRVAGKPRGDRRFDWDSVFIPDGYDRTFSELADTKNEISMRRRALGDFAGFLKGRSADAR